MRHWLNTVGVEASKSIMDLLEGNDLADDLQKEQTNPLLMQYMEDGFSQNLISRQKEIDSMLRKYIVNAKEQQQAQEKEKAQEQTQLYKTRWIRLSAIRNIIGFDVDVDVDIDPLFAKILTKAKAEVDGWEGKLYLSICLSTIVTKTSIFHTMTLEENLR
jgi:hypothetical protein